MSYLVLTLRAVLAGVFILSVVGKARGRGAFTAFAGAVRRIGGVPDRLAAPAAAVVIVLETGIVVLLAVPGTGTAGFVAAGVALLTFTVVLTAALRRGTTGPCRCFGVADEPIAWRHVWRNAALTGCAAAGAVLAPGSAGVSMRPAAVLLCLLGAMMIVATVVLLDGLVFLTR
jgi:uncharacterized membrane protein YphA (DoxX/SURF4 family)